MSKETKVMLILTDKHVPPEEEALRLDPTTIQGSKVLKTSLWNSENIYFHFLIQSYYWNSILIEATEPLTIQGLQHIHNCTSTVRLKMTEEVANSSLNVLCDLYPDKAPELRRARMSNKNLLDVIYS